MKFRTNPPRLGYRNPPLNNPHRTWYTLISRNWKELATMSCNIIIITILKIFPTKKIEIQMLNVRGDVYAE